MKALQKIKKAPPKRARKKPVSKAVLLAHSTRPILKHLRLVEHKHTGKLIHHRHTSHIALLILLFLVGIVLFMSVAVAQVQANTGTVSVGVMVPGPAPAVGALITSPLTETNVVDKYALDVTGTCAPGMFVVVHNNSQLAGSTVCTVAGIFVVQVQLTLGANILSALNYDNLDQPGPNTPLVNITVTVLTTALQQLQPASSVVPIVLPINPSVLPGVTPGASGCDAHEVQSLPVGGSPRVAVVCVPRFVQANTEQSLGITAWGGEPPYALEMSKGDDSDGLLLSLAAPGTKIIKFSYAKAGVYTIKIKLTDKEGKMAIVQTAVQATGDTATPIGALTKDILSTSWFKTPVPLYILAVAITLGFWGGDLFDRNFGARKPRHATRRAM